MNSNLIIPAILLCVAALSFVVLRWKKKEDILNDDRHNIPVIPSNMTLDINVNVVVSGGIVVNIKNATTDAAPALNKLTDSLKDPTKSLQTAISDNPVPTNS